MEAFACHLVAGMQYRLSIVHVAIEIFLFGYFPHFVSSAVHQFDERTIRENVRMK